MTKKQKSFLKALAASAGNISRACRLVGIDRTNYYKWRKNEEFKEAAHDVIEEVIDFAESSLIQQIKEKNTAATIFFLKTRAKDRGYTEKTEIEHSGQVQNQTAPFVVTIERPKD